MRALVFDGPSGDTSTTRIAELNIPQPGPGEVSIDVRYAGVNFKDVMARRGDRGYVTAWPFVPGLEVAGTIRALGAGVADLNVGERVAAVTNSGGLAEVAVASARLTVAVPAGLDLERAATAPGALTTAALLLTDIGRLASDEVLLVHSAAGGVGQAAAKLAQIAGVGTLLGTVGSANRLQAAKKAGYHTAFVRSPSLASEILERTGGRGVDLILDPQGTAQLDTDIDVAAPGARIVLFGNAAGAALAPLPPASRLFATNTSIGGFSLAALTATAPQRVTRALREVLHKLEAGELDVELTSVPDLYAAPKAQQALADGSALGKQVVRVACCGTQR